MMLSNIWKQFTSTVTSQYYTTKYHNILNVLYTQLVGNSTKEGTDQTRWPGAD